MNSVLKYIPNALTISRFLLALTFPFAPQEWWLSLIIISLVTEFFDGWMARWLKAVSDFGRLADPMADKLFVLSVVITLYLNDYVTMWQLLLISLRDITVWLGIAVLWSMGHKKLVKSSRPRLSGKVTTAFQFIFLISLFIWPPSSQPLLYLTVSAGLLSGIDYSLNALKRLRIEAPATP